MLASRGGFIVIGAIVLIALLIVAPLAPLVLFLEGIYVLAVLAAGYGIGTWPVTRLLGRERRAWTAAVATALGLGVLGFAALTLGVAGWLNAVTAWVLLAAGWTAGLAAVGRRKLGRRAEPLPPVDAPANRAAAVLFRASVRLPIAIPVFVVLFGASLPPGVLWDGEARGYDVLEYHLQAPREYFDAGRIHFLPHNVYASFPQQVEILYLLLMHLKGGAVEAALTAQLLHAALSALAVVAVAARFRGAARVGAALVAGATPWVAYTGCMAYVEGGVLLFTAVAAGVLLDALAAEGPTRRNLVLLAGVAAGMAGGCKYTALALVVVAGGAAWLAVSPTAWRTRVALAAAFFVAAGAAFAPWALRNAAFTGNPVYPFAYEVFGGRAWSDEQAEQWRLGHLPPAGERSPLRRAAMGAREWFGGRAGPDGRWQPSLFGFAVTLAAGACILALRRREFLFLLLWSGLMVVIWIATTHVPGRFVTPVIAPLAIAAGLWLERRERAAFGWRFGAVWVASAASAIVLLGVLVRHAQGWERRLQVPLAAMVDASAAFVQGMAANEKTPPDARVRIVGDAAVFYVQRELSYAVVFCRDPWVAFAPSAPPEEAIRWLRAHGDTHVLFAWSEIARLRGTYGFPAAVTPAWVETLVATGGLAPLQPGPPGRAAIEVYAVTSEAPVSDEAAGGSP